VSTQGPDKYTLLIQKDMEIQAPLAATFAALLEQLGPGNASPHGPMPMKLEAWPGGRWFRDLGNNTGHLWAYVQVIKPPTLLELHGPLFMSYAAISHVQYRLSETAGRTRLSLTHRASATSRPSTARARPRGGSTCSPW